MDSAQGESSGAPSAGNLAAGPLPRGVRSDSLLAGGEQACVPPPPPAPCRPRWAAQCSSPPPERAAEGLRDPAGVRRPSRPHLAWGHRPLPTPPEQMRRGAPKRDLALPQKPAGGPGRLDPREDGPLTKEGPRGEAGARGPLPEQQVARRPEPAPHTHLLSARLEARMPSRWDAPTTETRAPRGRADPALVHRPLTALGCLFPPKTPFL